MTGVDQGPRTQFCSSQCRSESSGWGLGAVREKDGDPATSRHSTPLFKPERHARECFFSQAVAWPLAQRAEALMIPFFAKASPLPLARRAEAPVIPLFAKASPLALVHREETLMIPLFAKASPLALARRAEARKVGTAGT